MTKEFLTCPICKRVLPAEHVRVVAVVDGEQTLICTDCNRKSETPQILLEIPTDWWSEPDTTAVG